jgi:hypothetical protein
VELGLNFGSAEQGESLHFSEATFPHHISGRVMPAKQRCHQHTFKYILCHGVESQSMLVHSGLCKEVTLGFQCPDGSKEEPYCYFLRQKSLCNFSCLYTLVQSS